MIRLALLLALLPGLALSQPLRIATYNTELSRDGPGLLLRDLRRDDPQAAQVIHVITAADPDILALQGIDWDADGQALAALSKGLAASGSDYPHRLHLRPNSGLATSLDLDGDGRTGGPGDAQGYGEFTGKGGMAVLSKYPIRTDLVRDYSSLLWRDLPGADLPQRDGNPFPSASALAAQRLSSTAHWVVPIDTPSGHIALLSFQAGPPVFDGPEDRNGRRNRDEIRFWKLLLDGDVGTPPQAPFVLLGGANLDPWDSEGRTEAIREILNDPRLQDPAPISAGGAKAGDQGHRTPDAQDTVDWPGVGRLRVDYALPSRHWQILDTGVFWPAPGQPGHDHAMSASRHRLVWIDLQLH